MRNDNQKSINGFVSRPSSRQVNGLTRPSVGRPNIGQVGQMPASVRQSGSAEPQLPRVGVSRAEIDESLKNIDDTDKSQPKKEHHRKSPKPPKIANKRKLIKRILLVLLILAIIVGGYIGIKAFLASSKAFQGNFFDFFKNAPLQQDENGRSNILVFGTSEDSEGGNHPGALLTDSIMVVSINQTTKDAYMTSIPRDLWIELGQTCPAGNQAKINELFNCISNGGQDEAAGAKALMNKVGQVVGMDMHYYAHVNYTVVADSVDAVGGVEVKIESSDPRGIYDPNFDWTCNYQCRMVDYEQGEIAQLDGEHALALARARNSAGGYGLSQGNFDREKNQQKILKALQQKAASVGTLTNVGKVTGLIDALGDNLRTNFQTKEIRTLMALGKEIPQDKINSISLVDEKNPVVTTGSIYGQSIVQPVAGLYDYSGIARYIREQISSDPVVKEAANIVVLNSSTVAGLAQSKADELEQQGFTISRVGNAPQSDQSVTTIYQLGDGKSATKQKLQKVLNTTITPGQPAVSVAGDTDFVVIIGQNDSPSEQ